MSRVNIIVHPHSEGMPAKHVRSQKDNRPPTLLLANSCGDIRSLLAQVIKVDAEQLHALLLCQGLPEGSHCLHSLLRWKLSLPTILLL